MKAREGGFIISILKMAKPEPGGLLTAIARISSQACLAPGSCGFSLFLLLLNPLCWASYINSPSPSATFPTGAWRLAPGSPLPSLQTFWLVLVQAGRQTSGLQGIPSHRNLSPCLLYSLSRTGTESQGWEDCRADPRTMNLFKQRYGKFAPQQVFVCMCVCVDDYFLHFPRLIFSACVEIFYSEHCGRLRVPLIQMSP